MLPVTIFFIILFTHSSLYVCFTHNAKFQTALWSLRCLNSGFETCEKLLWGSGFREDVRFENLENIFNQQSPRVKEALFYQNFTGLSENELCSMSRPLLTLIPILQLRRLDGESLGKLLVCHSDDLSVVQQIAFTARQSNSSDTFYRFLQSVQLAEPQLRIVGRSVTQLDNSSSIQIFLSERDAILEYLPPLVIAQEPSKMLSYIRNVNAQSWAFKPFDVKRVWAFFLITTEYPTSIVLWDDKTIEKWGHLLLGATGNELRSLQSSNIGNKTVFLGQNFSEIQARYLFDSFYGSSSTKYSVINSFKRLFPSLLPRHVQVFYAEAVNYRIIKEWRRIHSLATARQIVEYVVKSESNSTLKRFLAEGENIIKLDALTYSLPLRYFYSLQKKFPLVDLLNVQHEKMTEAQVFYLTNRGLAFEGDSTSFYRANALLRGLPTTFLLDTKPSTYDNLLTSLPANFPPRTAALLRLFWPKLTQQNVLQLLVQNPEFETFLDFLPSRFYTFHGDQLINSLLRLSAVDNTADKIPDLAISVLLAKYHKGQITWKIIDSRNGSSSQDFLLHGITCLDVEAMDPLEFTFIISRYNQRRKSVGKLFPSNLQTCSVQKLAEYLRMKSSFVPLYQHQSLLALLSPADIHSLGGFILAGLPVDELRKASHRSLIVQTIGSLTLSELMASAPMDKLLSIGELFVTEGFGLSVFDLGNLTHFLSVHSINEMKGPAFKLFLESGLFDKRMCSTDSQRSAWAYLIISGFGNPEDWTAQDLVTLGDMLFVMPFTEMERINDKAWTEAADIIAASTRYVDEIYWPQQGTPFYQACQTALKDPYEAEHYVRELSQFIGWLLLASQRQLNSIVPAESVASNKPQRSETPKKSSPPASTGKTQSRSWWRKFFSVFDIISNRGKRETQLVFNLTCDSIRMVGKSSELFLNAGILEKITDSELQDCLNEFAQMDLSDELKNHIWRRIIMKDIVLIGKLAAVVDVQDLIMVNLTKFDMKSAWGLELISTLGRYNLRNDSMAYVVNRLEGINDNKLSYEQLVALGPLTCHLPQPRSVITAPVFLKASRYLSSVLPCDPSCLEEFSQFVDHENSYGPVANWTSSDVESLGIFVSALDDVKWSVLVNDYPRSLSRLGIQVLRCLPKKRIEALTSAAVSTLPRDSAQFLMDFHSALLNETVRITLSERLSPNYQFSASAPLDEPSSGSKLLDLTVILITLSYFLMFYLY